MRGAALLLAAALALAAAPAGAQSRASGVVRRFIASDSAPVAGVTVVLHRIGRDRQGPVDSVRTDAAGRFRFSFPADTSALHLLTARYAGVQYFSQPVGTNPALPDTTLTIAVFDTASTATVVLDARHIVIAAPGEDGTRSVVELLSLANRGMATRVAPGDGVVWGMRLPPGAFGLAAGDGDLSAGAVDRRGDSLVVVSPIAPGERQLAIEYLLPPGAGELRIPFEHEAALVNLLLEEERARVAQPSLEPADSSALIQGRAFRRWSGAMTAGEVLAVVFPSSAPPGKDLLVGLVAATAVLLVAGSALALRRQAVAASTPADPDALADAIARLDREHERSDDVAGDGHEQYARRRRELKAELGDALARRRGRP